MPYTFLEKYRIKFSFATSFTMMKIFCGRFKTEHYLYMTENHLLHLHQWLDVIKGIFCYCPFENQVDYPVWQYF